MKILGVSKARWNSAKNTKNLGRRRYKSSKGRFLVYARDEFDRLFTFRIPQYAVFYWKLRFFFQKIHERKHKNADTD
jgi:hypothetical protein